jgi:diguanylate cyclase (GGDEF)-like protein/PAS domain S-box-containing protein
MTLRRRLFWLFSPLLLLTLLSVYALSEHILLSRFDRQDQQALNYEAQQLNLYLDSELKRHLSMLRSYAWWDASHAYMQQPNQSFIDYHLQSDVLINLAFDFMLYLDDQGQVVGEFWTPSELQKLQPVGQERPPSLASLRQAVLLRSQRLGSLDHADDPQHALAQLVVVQGIPILLLSSPISNSQASVKPAGVIVAGHMLDGPRLQQLQERTQASLRLLPPIDRAVAWPYLSTPGATASGGAQLGPRQLLDDGRQQVELLFRNGLGEAELRIEIGLPRLLHQEGRNAIGFFLGMALLVTFAAGLLLYLGLNKWVLQRVLRMLREISAIGHDRLPARLHDQGRDELGDLARELNQMLERLQQSEGRDRAILDSIQDGYFETDQNGKILKVNSALCRLLAYPGERLIGMPFEQLLDAQHIERARQLFNQALHGETSDTRIFAAPFKRGDSSQTYCEIRFSLIHDHRQQLTGYHGILRDTSDQMAYQSQLLDLAYRDPLTSLGNRKAFAEVLNNLLEESLHNNKQLALLYLDLDRFKEVNDRFGHDIGDALLMAIAERMSNTLRQPDFLYRLGGDEFTLLMPDSDGAQATTLAERLLGTLARPFELQGIQIDFVTPSIGIALYPAHASNAAQLIKAADQAMYRAKQVRNSICLYDPDPPAAQPLSPDR